MNHETAIDSARAGRPASLLNAAAYEALKERILTGRFLPGDVLGEVPLAHELGMSRTPIREALADLVSQRFLEKIPRRGVIVRKIDLPELLDITEMQACLLEMAGRRASGATSREIEVLEASLQRQREHATMHRISELLHEAREMDRKIVALSRNHEMMRIIDNLSDRLIFAGSFAALHQTSMQKAVDEHEAIVGGIRRRREQEVVTAVRAHYQAARLRLVGGSGGSQA